MKDNDLMLKIEGVYKEYRLGEIGGTTLKEELQRLTARLFKKADPTKKIGSKNYNKGEKFEALHNINLDVKKGERIGIIGHNGAGKSTLLKLISRVTAPTKGTIYLNGRITSMLEVGTGFHPELTGRENIYINGAILGMTKKEIDAKIENIIDFSEVREFIDTPVKRYSSGMYVKLAFSVAAHLDSEIIIMDEVLAVGDVAFQNKCLTKMKNVSLDEDRTILYVSHNMNTIRQLCDRVIVLDKGNIIFDGDVEKGIKIYLKEENNGSTIFNVALMKRPSLSLNLCTITSVEYPNKSTSNFVRGEPLNTKISWVCKETVNDVMFRVTFRNGSGTAIGTCIADKRFNCTSEKKYYAVLTFDTSTFSEDTYYLTISLINDDISNSTVLLDFAMDCCNFKIEECLGGDDVFADWNTFWWGNIHLPFAIMSTINEYDE